MMICTCHGTLDTRIANALPVEGCQPKCARRLMIPGVVAQMYAATASARRRPISFSAVFVSHALYEACLAISDDAPVRTKPTKAEAKHADQVRLWGWKK